MATHPDVFLDLPLTFDSLHKTVDQIVTVPFLRNFIDTMCIFCGFPAKGAMTAHMLYILERFFEESACYSVPIGGTCEMGNTLVRGLEKFGGKIQLNAHVDEIIVENDRAVGVRLKNGNVVKAKKAVVSNATPFDTVKMLGTTQELPDGVAKWREELGKLPRHGAIMHLFLAIDAEGLDLSHIEDPAHLVVQVSVHYRKYLFFNLLHIAATNTFHFVHLFFLFLTKKLNGTMKNMIFVHIGLGQIATGFAKSMQFLHPESTRQITLS